MNKKQSFILLFSIFISLFILIGCAPKKKEDQTIPEKNEVVKNKQEEIKPLDKNKEKEKILSQANSDAALELEEEKTFTLKEVDEPVIKSSYTIGSQKYLTLLPQIPGNLILPEDFHIGRLHDKGDSSENASMIEKTISDFFNSMKMKKISENLLSGGKESEFMRILTFHIDNNNVPQEFRIGTITIDNIDTASAIVRIFGKTGVTNGEIYLTKSENKWFISDMQVNFYDLETPGEDNKKKFMPTTYDWIFQGM